MKHALPCQRHEELIHRDWLVPVTDVDGKAAGRLYKTMIHGVLNISGSHTADRLGG